MKKVKVTLDDELDLTAKLDDNEEFDWDSVFIEVDDDSEEVYAVVIKRLDEDDVEQVFLLDAYDDEDDAHDFATDAKDNYKSAGVLIRVYVETVTIS